MIISTVVTTAHLISSFGLGAGGRWALQMDSVFPIKMYHDMMCPFDKWIHHVMIHFYWKDTDCIIQSMNFPVPHIDGTRVQSWHGNFSILFSACVTAL